MNVTGKSKASIQTIFAVCCSTESLAETLVWGRADLTLKRRSGIANCQYRTLGTKLAGSGHFHWRIVSQPTEGRLDYVMGVDFTPPVLRCDKTDDLSPLASPERLRAGLRANAPGYHGSPGGVRWGLALGLVVSQSTIGEHVVFPSANPKTATMIRLLQTSNFSGGHPDVEIRSSGYRLQGHLCKLSCKTGSPMYAANCPL
jgi:hypothetical protein